MKKMITILSILLILLAGCSSNESTSNAQIGTGRSYSLDGNSW